MGALEEMDLSMGNRQSTIDCMAKVVRAMLVCRQVTIKSLALKADVSMDTARRAMAGLLREGLARRTHPTPNSQNPSTPQREYLYVWTGAAD